MKFMIWGPSWEHEADAEFCSAPNLETACVLWARRHPEWDNAMELDVSVRCENGDVASCAVVANLGARSEFAVTVLATASAEEYEQGDGP